MLSNIYLTAIDERYGRWSMRSLEPSMRAARRRALDRAKGKPTFYMVRYEDDFVVLVEGTREQAEVEKTALAEGREERRVGEECVGTCRVGGSRDSEKKK